MSEKDYTGADDAPIEQPLEPGEGEVGATIPAEEIPQPGGDDTATATEGEGEKEDDGA